MHVKFDVSDDEEDEELTSGSAIKEEPMSDDETKPESPDEEMSEQIKQEVKEEEVDPLVHDSAISDLDYLKSKKVATFKEESDESDSDEGADSDAEELNVSGKRNSEKQPNSSKKRKLVVDLDTKSKGPSSLWFDQDIFNDIDMDEVEHEPPSDIPDDAGTSEDESVDGFEVVPQQQDDGVGMWDADDIDEDEEKRKQLLKNGLTTAEAVSLAQELVNRRITKSQLVDDGFSRYSLNSKEGLPSWFLDDEAQYYKPNIPITKEAMDMLRARQRALDARPIKKVAEAKARKKMKAVQKLQKALKKAEGVNDATDMSEKEKSQQIQKLMKSGLSKANAKRKSDIKVVVAKGAHRGIKGRPKGVKGRYQMVDPRMRKELRAKKRKEKAAKKR